MNTPKKKNNSKRAPRIFLFRFHSRLLVHVARELKRKGVDILYWSDEKSFFDEISQSNEFSGTIFHSAFDAALGIPAPSIDSSIFPPVNKALSKEFLECESQVIRMMDTLDLDSTVTVAKKKNVYYKYLRYLHPGLFTI